MRPEPLTYVDGDLDENQREAVARAVFTPDLCLIRGLPGTGKSRVVSEIVLQAAARGERVLLLAPTPAALDRVLERVGGNETRQALADVAHRRVRGGARQQIVGHQVVKGVGTHRRQQRLRHRHPDAARLHPAHGGQGTEVAAQERRTAYRLPEDVVICDDSDR